MKNWLWDKKFKFMAWLKSPYMKRAAERFLDNEFVAFLCVVLLMLGYIGFWACIGIGIATLAGNNAVGAISAVIAAILTVCIVIFIGYYRKTKADYLEYGRVY